MKKFVRKQKIDIDPEVSKVSEGSEKEEVEQNEEAKESIEKVDTPSNTIEGKVEAVKASDLLGIVPEYTGADPLAGETLEPEPIDDEEGEEGERSPYKGQRNENGEVFDPSIHAVDDEGKPKLTKSGKYSKKRGRRAGAAKSGYLEGEDLNQSEAKAAAATYFAIFKNAGDLLIDPDFSKHSKEEGEMVLKALEAVCIENNSTGLTPTQMLAASLVTYSAPRITTPTAKDRLKLYYVKFTGLFKRNKKKTQAVTEVLQTPIDNWPQG